MAPQNPGSGSPQDPRPGDRDRNYGDLGRDAEREARRAAERRDPGRSYGFSEPARQTNNWWWLLLPLAALAALGIWALSRGDDDKTTDTPTTPGVTTGTTTSTS